MDNSNNRLVPIDLSAARERRQARLQEAAAELKAAGLDADQLLAMVRDAEQWTIEEKPDLQLPYSLASALTLALRDEGNNLLGELQLLNASVAGVRYDVAKMMLGPDLEFIDLCERHLDWGARVTQQLLHRVRNRVKVDPLLAYGECLSYLADFTPPLTANFERSIYEMVWAPVLTQIGFKFADALILQKGLLQLDADPSGNGELRLRGPVANEDSYELERDLRQFCHVSAAFTEQILVPHVRAAAMASPPASVAEIDARFRSMVADLYEAYPVLLHEADEIVTFPVPGLESPGYFLFSEVGGVGAFGVASISFPLISLQWDGQMSFAGLPWRTLQDCYGRDDFMRVAAWLVQQVHDAVVETYFVCIEQARQRLPLDAAPTQPPDPLPDVASYVAWVQQAEEEVPADDAGEPGQEPVLIPRIPQLRRNLFFKILQNCGVRIEQGKGSELKLLREGKRPYVLGNHNQTNRRIPAFVAAAILRRLEITYAEWRAAYKAC